MTVFDWWTVVGVLALVLAMILPFSTQGDYKSGCRGERHPDVPLSLRWRVVILVAVMLTWVFLTFVGQATDEDNEATRQNNIATEQAKCK